MGNKSAEICDVVDWLREHVCHELTTIDYWDADQHAIGIAVSSDHQRLAYISTWNRPSQTYFVELEDAPAQGSDLPYTSMGKFESVGRKRLAEIVVEYLAISRNRYACPCCGFRTLDQQPPGTYDICPVCFWEDDRVQFHDHAYAGGANHPSLDEARQNFKEFGACERAALQHVRPPLPEEMPTRTTERHNEDE